MEEEQLHRLYKLPETRRDQWSINARQNCSSIASNNKNELQNSELFYDPEQAYNVLDSSSTNSLSWPPTSEEVISPEGDHVVIHHPLIFKHRSKRRLSNFFFSDFGI